MAYAQIILKHKDDSEKTLIAGLGIYWPSIIGMLFVPQLACGMLALLGLSTSGDIDLVNFVFFFALYLVLSMISFVIPYGYERYRKNNHFNKKVILRFHFWISVILFFVSLILTLSFSIFSVYLLIFLLLSFYSNYNLSGAFKAGYVVKSIKLTKLKTVLNKKLNISNEESLNKIENKVKKIQEKSLSKKDKNRKRFND